MVFVIESLTCAKNRMIKHNPNLIQDRGSKKKDYGSSDSDEENDVRNVESATDFFMAMSII